MRPGVTVTPHVPHTVDSLFLTLLPGGETRNRNFRLLLLVVGVSLGVGSRDPTLSGHVRCPGGRRDLTVVGHLPLFSPGRPATSTFSWSPVPARPFGTTTEARTRRPILHPSYRCVLTQTYGKPCLLCNSKSVENLQKKKNFIWRYLKKTTYVSTSKVTGRFKSSSKMPKALPPTTVNPLYSETATSTNV